MNQIKIVFFFLLFAIISINGFAQNNFEFFGILKLNNDNSKLISYRLVFTEKDGIISGYSVTDLDGSHETKNSVTGTYNSDTKIFSFKESDILYTKSTYSENVFCFINYTGKIKLVNKNSKLDGEFKGMFKNKQACINGTLSLIGSENIIKKMTKLSKKINKSKKIDEKTKSELNPNSMIDELKINKLSKDQNLNIFWSTKKIKVEVFDDKTEDGDVINLKTKDKDLLSNYKVTKNIKTINIDLNVNQLVFTIEALDEGKFEPNTAKIILYDGDRTFELLTNMKKGEKASITIIKKESN